MSIYQTHMFAPNNIRRIHLSSILLDAMDRDAMRDPNSTIPVATRFSYSLDDSGWDAMSTLTNDLRALLDASVICIREHWGQELTYDMVQAAATEYFAEIGGNEPVTEKELIVRDELSRLRADIDNL